MPDNAASARGARGGPAPIRVVCGGAHGTVFRGHPRALFEHLCRDPRFAPVWVSASRRITAAVQARHGPHRAAFLYSGRGLLAMARAEVVAFSHGLDDFPGVPPGPRALRLNLWHGLPTKCGELMPPPGTHLTAAQRRRFERRFARWDLMLSPGRMASAIYARRFGMTPDRVLELGAPDLEPLLDDRLRDPRVRAERRHALLPHLPRHRAALLYAPTFRTRDPVEFFPVLDGPGAVRRAGRALVGRLPAFRGEPTRFLPFPDASPSALARDLEQHGLVLLLRPHPNERADLDALCAASPRIVRADTAQIPDPVTLLAAADGVVTDYSGIFFEGLLMDLPCVFIPGDFARWERGIPWDYETMTPGPHCRTQRGFVDALVEAADGGTAWQAERSRVREAMLGQVVPGAAARLAEVLYAWCRDRQADP